MSTYMYVLFALLLKCFGVYGSYPCLCSYTLMTPVYTTRGKTSQTLGNMYEYDCKPTYPIIVADNSGFTAVQFGGQIGYVASNPGYLSIESCPGVPMKGDLVVSTSAPSSTASTTVIITTPGSSSPPSTQTTASTTQSTPITASTKQSTPTTTLTTQNTPTTTLTTQNTPTTTSTTQSTTTTTSTTQSTTTTASTTRSTTTTASTTQSATTTASTSQSTTTTASTTRSTTTTASTTKNIPTTAPVTHGSVSKLVPVTATIIVPKTTVKHHSNHHRTTKHSTAAVTQKTITSTVHSQSTTPSVHSQSTRCHNNWVYQFQSCYYFNMVDSLRHLQASDYCAHHNAHLVFIDSQQKQQWFASQLSTLFSHTSGSTQHPMNIWTGGVRHGTVWNWVNGKSDTHSPFGYKTWTPSYPDVALNSHDKACLGIVASNGSHWKDFACKRQFHFICERGANPLPGNHVQTTPPSTGTQNGCEPGWTFHDKSCYLFNFKDQIGLTAAENACHHSRSHLVFIDNREEQMFLMGHIRSLYNIPHYSSSFWLGGDYVHHSWTWVDAFGHKTSMTFTNWVNHQPDNSVGNCVVMLGGNNFQWSSARCRDHNYYICEKELKQSQHLIG